MPPVSSPGSLDSQTSRSTAGDRAARIRFRRAMSLMLMTLLLPGSAQVIAGNRRVGWIALWTWAAVVLTSVSVLLTGAIWHGILFHLAFDTSALLLRRAAIGFNGVLCFSIVAALLFGAHVVGVQRQFILAMSGDGGDTSAHDGRYNVLLLGGDSGAGRWGLRPDSMTVASVDADTGRTVLISLPRNMENFPFAKGSVMHEQFPDGFDADYLNGVSTWASDNTELFPHADNPGVEATVSAIEGITGLKINYWAMVNLEGFKDLVDAFGGVTLHVRQPIPVGGLGDDVTGYIQPGVRKLDGHDTLWFARARDDSDDYSRMARQKCVMNAMLRQISPQTAVSNFAQIAQASSAMVSTNIPSSEFSRFVQLALKARGQQVSTLSLVPPMINTADPDIKLVRAKVAEAIDKAEGSAPASAAAKKHRNAPVTGGSIGSLSTGYAANEATDLDAAC
jgi:LCP family protein required for cell wall assembly